MPDGYYLSPEEAADFLAMRQEFRTRRGNPQLRPAENPSTGPAPEVYVAKAPTGGIPPITGTTPGSAECDIYRLVDSGLEAVGAGVSRTVYNLSTFRFNSWVTLTRDKYGKWFAQQSATGPCTTGVTIPMTDIRCVNGTQYKDSWNTYLSIDANGCIVQSPGQITTTVIGCCDCPGTGTSPNPNGCGTACCFGMDSNGTATYGSPPSSYCLTITNSALSARLGQMMVPGATLTQGQAFADIINSQLIGTTQFGSSTSSFHGSTILLQSCGWRLGGTLYYDLGGGSIAQPASLGINVSCSQGTMNATAGITAEGGGTGGGTTSSPNPNGAYGFCTLVSCSPFTIIGRVYFTSTLGHEDFGYIDFLISAGACPTHTGTGSPPPPPPPPPPPLSCCSAPSGTTCTVTRPYDLASGNGMWDGSTATLFFADGSTATVSCSGAGIWTYSDTNGHTASAAAGWSVGSTCNPSSPQAIITWSKTPDGQYSFQIN